MLMYPVKCALCLGLHRVGQLLKLRKLVTISNQRKLRLASVNTRVWGVFLVTGLDRIFDFREAAIQRLLA